MRFGSYYSYHRLLLHFKIWNHLSLCSHICLLSRRRYGDELSGEYLTSFSAPCLPETSETTQRICNLFQLRIREAEQRFHHARVWLSVEWLPIIIVLD